MLLVLNNLLKEYEPIIKFMWAIFPFMVTIFMAYIAYQQWLITKRDSNIDLSKQAKENFYNPLKKYIGRIIFSIFVSKEKKSNFKNDRNIYFKKIEQALKQSPFIVKEYNDELIKYSFDLLCHLNSKQKNPIVIKNSWKLYKKASQWFFNACIPDEIKIKVCPNRLPNIYSVIKNIIKIVYKFLTPYFLQDKISNLYINIGFYFWFWLIAIHILQQSLLNKIKEIIKKINDNKKEQEKNQKEGNNE